MNLLFTLLGGLDMFPLIILGLICTWTSVLIFTWSRSPFVFMCLFLLMAFALRSSKWSQRTAPGCNNKFCTKKLILKVKENNCELILPLPWVLSFCYVKLYIYVFNLLKIVITARHFNHFFLVPSSILSCRLLFINWFIIGIEERSSYMS